LFEKLLSVNFFNRAFMPLYVCWVSHCRQSVMIFAYPKPMSRINSKSKLYKEEQESIR
jgi:hypothetical protein